MKNWIQSCVIGLSQSKRPLSSTQTKNNKSKSPNAATTGGEHKQTAEFKKQRENARWSKQQRLQITRDEKRSPPSIDFSNALRRFRTVKIKISTDGRNYSRISPIKSQSRILKYWVLPPLLCESRTLTCLLFLGSRFCPACCGVVGALLHPTARRKTIAIATGTVIERCVWDDGDDDGLIKPDFALA